MRNQDWKELDKYLLGESSDGPPDGDILREVLARPFEYPEGKGYRGIPITTVRPPNHVWRYVSITMVVLIAIIGIKYIPDKQNSSDIKTYSTNRGQRATVTLLDGSIATLAPATTIRVNNREVDLTGEAVFTVTKHTESPFTVKTGSTITRVLGTRFGIRAYDGNIRIAVQDGKVAFDKNVLTDGDVGIINNSNINIHHNVDISSLLSWTTGTLVFDDTTVSDVIAEVERSFDINLQLADALTFKRRVTITVRLDDAPREVVSTLAMALGVKATWSGNTAILK